MNKLISLLLTVLLLFSLTVAAAAAGTQKSGYASREATQTDVFSWRKDTNSGSNSQFGQYRSSNYRAANYFRSLTEFGTASQRITGKDIIWLPVIYNGAYYWFGLDNTNGAFKSSDTFSVKLFSPALSQKDWDKNASSLDKSSLNSIENDGALLFELSVNSANADRNNKKASKNSAAKDAQKSEAVQDVPVYLSLGSGCNLAGVKALNVLKEKDTAIETAVVTLDGPEGSQDFLSLTLQSGSLCLVNPHQSANSGASLWTVIAIAEAAIIAGLAVRFTVKRKK